MYLDDRINFQEDFSDIYYNGNDNNIPGLITLYFNEPDHSGHVFGPNHINTQLQIELADSILGYLLNSISD